MTVRQALREAAAELRRAGCPSPHVDAEHLLTHATGLRRTALYLEPEAALESEAERRFRALVARRAQREPLAYVLGEWGFRHLTLKVDPRVLIPRPETEVVVDRCLALLADIERPEVLDVGVGSGAIALAIADENAWARITGFDNSKGALAVASANLAATGLDGRVRLVHHDLRGEFGRERFDLVVSNPPYVEAGEVERLEPEVRDWEPREALVSQGATEAVARRAYDALRRGGWLVLEVGDGRARQIAALLEDLGYDAVAIDRDLAGSERIVSGRKR